MCEGASPSTDADACPASPLGSMLAVVPLGKILELRRKGKLRDGTALVLAVVEGTVGLVLWLLAVVVAVVVVLLWWWQMACSARAGEVA